MHVLISQNAYRFYKEQFCSMYSSCFANFSFSKPSKKIMAQYRARPAKIQL